jgi:hypothetical protein
MNFFLSLFSAFVTEIRHSFTPHFSSTFCCFFEHIWHSFWNCFGRGRAGTNTHLHFGVQTGFFGGKASNHTWYCHLRHTQNYVPYCALKKKFKVSEIWTLTIFSAASPHFNADTSPSGRQVFTLQMAHRRTRRNSVKISLPVICMLMLQRARFPITQVDIEKWYFCALVCVCVFHTLKYNLIDGYVIPRTATEHRTTADERIVNFQWPQPLRENSCLTMTPINLQKKRNSRNRHII